MKQFLDMVRVSDKALRLEVEEALTESYAGVPWPPAR